MRKFRKNTTTLFGYPMFCPQWTMKLKQRYYTCALNEYVNMWWAMKELFDKSSLKLFQFLKINSFLMNHHTAWLVAFLLRRTARSIGGPCQCFVKTTTRRRWSNHCYGSDELRSYECQTRRKYGHLL